MEIEGFEPSTYKKIEGFGDSSMVLQKYISPDDRILLVLKASLDSKSGEIFLGEHADDFSDQDELIESAYKSITSLEKYGELVGKYRDAYQAVFKTEGIH